MLCRILLLAPLWCILTGILYPSFAQTGLFHTPAEVAIWQKRANSGPYRVKGDAVPGSPNDWERIAQNANAFLANPSAERWDGNNESAIYQRGNRLRDAAFFHLVTRYPNHTSASPYSTAAKNELLAQVSVGNTDFGARKASGNIDYKQDNEWFFAPDWFMKIMFTYDYIKETMNSTERQKVEKWLKSNAYYWAEGLHKGPDAFRGFRGLGAVWPNRLNEDYSVYGREAEWGNMMDRYTHLTSDGRKHNRISYLSQWYNNRRSAQNTFPTLAGIMLNDATLIKYGKLYIKELLMFGTFPDGMTGESSRNGDYNGVPQQGSIAYQAVNTASALFIANALARKGDNSLFSYTTSKGMHGTEGGNKNLRLLVDTHCKLIANTFSTKRYYDRASARTGDRIDAVDEDGHTFGRQQWVHDIWYSVGNQFWKDNFIKDVYTRRNSSLLSSHSNVNGYEIPNTKFGSAGPFGDPWRGWGGQFPGILFMYGQMEGVVNPFNGSSTTEPITEPPVEEPVVEEPATQPPSASDGSAIYRINSGGSAFQQNGENWSADSYFSGGRTHSSSSTVQNTSYQSLYRTERWGNFTYELPVNSGSYDVNLHFAEVVFHEANNRVFSVSIEGKTVISRYDIFGDAGRMVPVEKSFQDIQVNDGKLTITFTSHINNAKISGIEVLTGNSSTISDPVNQSPEPTSDETLYRINSGGGSFNYNNVNWSGDRYFSGGNTHTSSSTVENTPLQSLYRSERWGNFVYDFPAESGTYDVVLHFAENVFHSSNERVFSVSIEGNTVLSRYDIFADVGRLKPTQKKFTGISVTDGKLTIQFVRHVNNAKISGIEIIRKSKTSSARLATNVKEEDSEPFAPTTLLGEVPMISLYPNPSFGTFQLDLHFEKPENIRVSIHTVSGQEVESRVYENLQFLKESFQLSKKGLYLISIESGKQKFVERVIVQ
jgi:hypothetical protein